VRVEITGPGKYEHVGKSQPALIVINPMIFTRTRTPGARARGHAELVSKENRRLVVEADEAMPVGTRLFVVGYGQG
jgi:hypothetical protein